jgi:hypothetical protein
MRTADALIEPPAAVADAPRVEPVSLVLVCAWCGRSIGRAATSSRRIVSHGMCRPCLDEMFPGDGEPEAPAR